MTPEPRRRRRPRRPDPARGPDALPLEEVSALLLALHERLRVSPVPLDIAGVVDTTRQQLSPVLRTPVVVVLLSDDQGRTWRSVYAEGATPPGMLTFDELPAQLILSDPGTSAHAIADLGPDGGVTADARSGVYLLLWRQGHPFGLLALEDSERRVFTPEQLAVVERLAAPLALALDHARGLERLGNLYGAGERRRLGEQLHDRFAQSLAYVGLGLDRLAARYQDDAEVAQLRDDVRATLADFRETLRELRLQCTEQRPLAVVLGEHVDRFGRHHDLEVTFSAPAEAPRPPVPVEDQLLRIAVELLHLARSSADTSSVHVQIVAEPGRLRLVVSDDGPGLPEQQLEPAAASTLMLVRQRAAEIGGLVDVIPRPGQGTRVAVTLHGLPEMPADR